MKRKIIEKYNKKEIDFIKSLARKELNILNEMIRNNLKNELNSNSGLLTFIKEIEELKYRKAN